VGVQSLIPELDVALNSASRLKCESMLRQVTDLFLRAAPSYSSDQLALFDLVIGNLIQKVDNKALLELSKRLGSIDNAPAEAIKRLAFNDDLTIAGPLLEKSNKLDDQALVEIATDRSQGHLLAIAGRTPVNEPVTNVLVARGNSAVMHKSFGNLHAHFSAQGFVRALNQAKTDKLLAELIAARKDLPAELQPFLQLAMA
jgi:uncharacterized protein (DUF2336 family)